MAKFKKCAAFAPILIQALLFYCLPLFAGPTDIMGMIFIILSATFVISFLIGLLEQSRFKYLYPIITAVIFIPSVFIYYNESALVHSLWYFVISCIGLFFGALLCRILNNRKRSKK